MIPAIDPQRRRLLLAAPALWLATATPLARAAGNGWQPWPRPLAVPGGVARIALGAEITAPQAFNAAGHPLLVVGSAYRFRLLTRSGAIAAFALGFVVFGFGGWSWALVMIGFFVSSSGLSLLFKKNKKKKQDKIF